MAQPYVTGPCEVFVETGQGSEGRPTFFGHCERTPNVMIRPHYLPVFCDYSGRNVPADMVYDGEEALVSLDLTRYNEDVYALLAHRVSRGLGGDRGVVRGTNDEGEIGTLMVRGRATRQLWLRFPYSGKAAMGAAVSATRGGPLPAGYHFFAAYLEGPDALGPLANAARRLHVVFHCMRRWENYHKNRLAGAGTVYNDTLQLYDHNMTACDGLTAL